MFRITSYRPITTTTGAIVPSDQVVTCNPPSALALSLFSAQGQRQPIALYNLSTQTITITPAAGTINGASSFVWTGTGAGLFLVPDSISNWIVAGASLGTDLATAIAAAGTAAVNSNTQQVTGGTIATTGNSDTYFTCGRVATLSSVAVTPLVALTANDTNYITFTITNLGQAGAGTAVMLAATAPNTTKATGGTGLAINTPRVLTLSGVDTDLHVAINDLLLIRAAATGTLANTVTRPIWKLTFMG